MPHKRSKEKRIERSQRHEPRISPFNRFGVFDPTPHNAIHIMRGEPDKIIYTRQHRPHYPYWHPECWED